MADITTATSNYNITSHSYQLPLSSFGFAVALISFSLATVGCVLTIILMVRTKICSDSFSVYFSCLAVSDFGVAVCMDVELVEYWLFKAGLAKTYFVYGHFESCLAMIHLLDIFRLISLWLFVAVAANQLMMVVYPHKRHAWDTKGRSVVVVLCIALLATAFVLVGTLANIENLIAASNQAKGACNFEIHVFTFGYRIFLDLVVALLVPITIVIVIAIKIKAALRRMGRNSDARAAINNAIADESMEMAHSLFVMGMNAAATLVPIALFTLVETIMNFASGYRHLYAADILWQLFEFLSVFNYCCKFFILMATNETCRKDMARIILRLFGRYTPRGDDTDKDSMQVISAM